MWPNHVAEPQPATTVPYNRLTKAQVAAYATTDETGGRHLRRGVASHFLERLAAPLLEGGNSQLVGKLLT